LATSGDFNLAIDNFDASEGHYATDTEFVTGQLSLAGAKMLAQRGAAPLEIDSVNIVDDTTKGRRPAHTILLDARIPSLKTSLAYGKRGGCADLAEHGFRRSVAGSMTGRVGAKPRCPKRDGRPEHLSAVHVMRGAVARLL
jgi:hypothetical protein